MPSCSSVESEKLVPCSLVLKALSGMLEYHARLRSANAISVMSEVLEVRTDQSNLVYELPRAIEALGGQVTNNGAEKVKEQVRMLTEAGGNVEQARSCMNKLAKMDVCHWGWEVRNTARAALLGAFERHSSDEEFVLKCLPAVTKTSSNMWLSGVTAVHPDAMWSALAAILSTARSEQLVTAVLDFVDHAWRDGELSHIVPIIRAAQQRIPADDVAVKLIRNAARDGDTSNSDRSTGAAARAEYDD
jgi:hypothetical protein